MIRIVSFKRDVYEDITTGVPVLSHHTGNTLVHLAYSEVVVIENYKVMIDRFRLSYEVLHEIEESELLALVGMRRIEELRRAGQYGTLQDACKNNAVSYRVRTALALGPTEVWYARENTGILIPPDGESIRPETLSSTHILLGCISSEDPDLIFYALQGDFYAPKGEANGMVRMLGIDHTSMSVGDVLVIDGNVVMCMPMGWQRF